MTSSLVGSEMCIRDRLKEQGFSCQVEDPTTHVHTRGERPDLDKQPEAWICLLYTSDAADDM
eukprot:3035367-Prorocentrum_lima.AAC.1